MLILRKNLAYECNKDLAFVKFVFNCITKIFLGALVVFVIVNIKVELQKPAHFSYEG